MNKDTGIRKIAPYESSYLRKLPPWNLPSGKITPNKILSPLINHTNERKSKIIKFFSLEESCAIQHPYQNNQGPHWYTDDLTENSGLRYFFLYRMKKIQKSNESENRTGQGELKLGSQIIKFGKYVKLLNFQLSMHITLWIFKKSNSKMHALGRSVTILYECGCVLAVHLSIMYTLQIYLIGTNPKVLTVFSWFFMLFCSNI